MQVLFPAFLNAGISGSVMIAAVLALRLVLKRAPRSMVCLLWLLVVVRLLCPFSIPTSFSLQPPLRYTPTEVSETLVLQHSPLPGDTDAPIALDPGVFPTPQISPDGTQLSPATPQPESPVSATAILGLVWLLGVGIMLLYAFFSYLRLRWRVRDAIPAEGYFQVYDLGTAFVLGFVKPRIYLPVELDGQCRGHVLCHEQAHIARGDHWLKLLAFLALAVHWYNPLVWLSFWLLCRDIEIACDQRVIAGKDAAFRQSYSAALLKCSARTTVHACPIAFAEVSVKDRIRAVLNYRKSALWLIILGIIAIVCVAVFLMPDPAPPDDPIPDDTAAQDPGTFPMPQVDPDSNQDAPGWGLTLRAEGVTPSGCTLVFTQSGGLTYQDNSGATVTGTLTTGAMFYLQSFDGNQWKGVTPIAKIQWDAILHFIPLNDSRAMDIRWEDLYGKLPTGTYRLCKEITGPGSNANPITHNYYAEFTITDATYDKAGLLEVCRNALEEFQSRGWWFIEQTHSYPQWEQLSALDTWWIIGEDFLLASDSADGSITSCTMYRDGAWFQKLGGVVMDESLDVDIWYPTDLPIGLLQPWILLLEWEEDSITLLDHQAAMGAQEVTLSWRGPFFMFAHDNEYMEVTLRLDSSGKIEGAVLSTSINGNPYTSTLTDLGYSMEFVRNYIDSQPIGDPIVKDPGEFPTPELAPNS